MAKTSLPLVAAELVPGLAVFPDIDFGVGLERLRAGFAAMPRPPLPPALEAVACVERLIPGAPGDPDVRILHYTPPAPVVGRPVLLHMHGGGYVLGTPDMNDVPNRALALAMGCEVVSVDYRLAPETRWPGSLHDNYAALLWLHANASELGVDAARIALAGESAGGGQAVALALHARNLAARDAAAPKPCFLLLDSPMLDDRTGSPADADPHPVAGEFVWTPARNRFGWGALLGVEAGAADVPAGSVPARVDDVSGLPPHFIFAGALDLLCEEDMKWARRLMRAGVPVELHVVPGAYHGFTVVADSPQAEAMQRAGRAALARAWGQAGAQLG